jgi:hypothetical protein
VTEMHTKNPWEDIKGAKHNGLRRKLHQSLMDCIEFHKLAVFTINAVERLKYYLMCSVKNPMRWSIRMHISCMEALNKYLGILPIIKNSSLAVASTEMGNVPFTKATHASIILSHLPVAWRNHYNLTHSTVPESPRAMLMDLQNIEKLFVKKYNEKARANKAKAATASKMAERMPKKCVHGGGSDKGAPKRAVLSSIASGARRRMGPIPPTIPSSVAGLRKTASQRTSLLSPSTPQRSPGKRQVADIPVRWLI